MSNYLVYIVQISFLKNSNHRPFVLECLMPRSKTESRPTFFFVAYVVTGIKYFCTFTLCLRGNDVLSQYMCYTIEIVRNCIKFTKDIKVVREMTDSTCDGLKITATN